MSLMPRWGRFGKRGNGDGLSKFFENLEDDFNLFSSQPTGLSVSSDDKNVYIEADVPGLTAKEVDVSIDNQGVLWIKGEKKQEDKTKKYYRKSHQSFSYCIPLWEEIDEKSEPQATCKDGIMRITFAKKKDKQVEAKRIDVKDR